MASDHHSHKRCQGATPLEYFGRGSAFPKIPESLNGLFSPRAHNALPIMMGLMMFNYSKLTEYSCAIDHQQCTRLPLVLQYWYTEFCIGNLFGPKKGVICRGGGEGSLRLTMYHPQLETHALWIC